MRDSQELTSDKPATILLVDDEADVLRVLIRMLKRAGHEVIGCVDVNEVQWHISNGLRPDLLITDIVLPGSNGRKVAALVKLASPKTKVVYISGANVTISEHNVLQKPFTSQELVELVDQVLA